MGYDLKATNKELESFTLNISGWDHFLKDIAGNILGTGDLPIPDTYTYTPDKSGNSPRNNNGYFVTKKQADAIAMAASGHVHIQKAIHKEWDRLAGKEVYHENKRWIEIIEEFAEWLSKSKGFRIY